MTAPTPNAPAGELQPKVALREAEEVARRERLPTVLRAYAVQFDEYFVSDSDAGNSARRAADEIVSLRAALLAARREVEAKDALLRDFARASANLINAATPASKYSHTIPSGFLAALGSLTNDAAAALAATPEEK